MKLKATYVLSSCISYLQNPENKCLTLSSYISYSVHIVLVTSEGEIRVVRKRQFSKQTLCIQYNIRTAENLSNLIPSRYMHIYFYIKIHAPTVSMWFR